MKGQVITENNPLPIPQSHTNARLARIVGDIAKVTDRMCFLHRLDVPAGGTNEHNRLTENQRVVTLKRLVIQKLQESL